MIPIAAEEYKTPKFDRAKARRIQNKLLRCPFDQVVDLWRILRQGGLPERELCQLDRYYLLTVALGRRDALHPWLYHQCRMVELSPDGHLDLWAREHYKSTIITFAGVIQNILCDPNVTVGIFSHTASIAAGFLRQIKRELESNTRLQTLFPDILYSRPGSQSPKWSEMRGLLVKRDANPNAATVESSGLVDGQPTSRHYSLLVYDDIVTRETVATVSQMDKALEAWRDSLNLGARRGRRWMVGTRWAEQDPYWSMQQQGSVNVRVHPATRDGTPSGVPVLWSRSELQDKIRDLRHRAGAHLFLSPTSSDERVGFVLTHMQYYETEPQGVTVIVVDPANSKKPSACNTAMMVVTYGADKNYYLREIVRGKFAARERADHLTRLHRRYRPWRVNYEQYGMQCDIDYIKERQDQESYRYSITAFASRVSKEDRIDQLIALVEDHRLYLKRAYPGPAQDDWLREEVIPYHPSRGNALVDGLDALAQICYMDIPEPLDRWGEPPRRRHIA